MSKYTVRVTAHYGEVRQEGNMYMNDKVSCDYAPQFDAINNVEQPDEVVELNVDGCYTHSWYTLDDLIDDFEHDNTCRVAFGDDIDPPNEGDMHVREFDIFEPSLTTRDAARLYTEDLASRIIDWTDGYPRGR